MNTKLNFISSNEVEPVQVKQKEQIVYSEIVKTLDTHFSFRGELVTKWNQIINSPEYVLIKNVEGFGIKTTSDNLEIVNVCDEKLALSIEILMNLAYREGAKHVIQVLEYL